MKAEDNFEFRISIFCFLLLSILEKLINSCCHRGYKQWKQKEIEEKILFLTKYDVECWEVINNSIEQKLIS